MKVVKLTKKFEEMSLKERVRESVKMLLFKEVVVSEYEVDMGDYMHAHWKNQKLNSRVTEMNMVELKHRLVETQKLLAKYNYEYRISGYEIIDVRSDEYKDLVEPFKVKTRGSKQWLFNAVFSSKVAHS